MTEIFTADWQVVNDETVELKLCAQLTGYVEEVFGGEEFVGYVLTHSAGEYVYRDGFTTAADARAWVEDKIVTSRQYRDAINKVAVGS